MATRRIKKEYKNLLASPVDGCTARPKHDNNVFEWTATVEGPPGSPYEGGTFSLDVSFPANYPLKPPVLTSTTKAYHPNVNGDTGLVGLPDVHESQWCPVVTISHILMSLAVLLGKPHLECAVMPEIVHEYERERDAYNKTAREWTEKYAK